LENYRTNGQNYPTHATRGWHTSNMSARMIPWNLGFNTHSFSFTVCVSLLMTTSTLRLWKKMPEFSVTVLLKPPPYSQTLHVNKLQLQLQLNCLINSQKLWFLYFIFVFFHHCVFCMLNCFYSIFLYATFTYDMCY